MGIKAVDTTQEYGTNDCDYRKNNCSHLCFHKAHKGAVCACPTRMELAVDGKTCNGMSFICILGHSYHFEAVTQLTFT